MSSGGLPLEELFAKAPLYAILDTAARPELSCQAILEALLRAGVKVIQYRHKEKFRRGHFEECALLARRTREWGTPVAPHHRAHRELRQRTGLPRGLRPGREGAEDHL